MCPSAKKLGNMVTIGQNHGRGHPVWESMEFTAKWYSDGRCWLLVMKALWSLQVQRQCRRATAGQMYALSQRWHADCIIWLRDKFRRIQEAASIFYFSALCPSSQPGHSIIGIDGSACITTKYLNWHSQLSFWESLERCYFWPLGKITMLWHFYSVMSSQPAPN